METKTDDIVSRLLPYWVTVVAAFWTLTYWYLWNSENANANFDELIVQPLFSAVHDTKAKQWGGVFVGNVGTFFVASSLAILLLTANSKLPAWRTSWVNQLFAYARQFEHRKTNAHEDSSGIISEKTPSWKKAFEISVSAVRDFKKDDANHGRDIVQKRNQYGVGEINYNWVAIWFIILPTVLGFLASLPSAMRHATEKQVNDYPDESVVGLKLLYASLAAGFAAVLALSFFLIPVTRHSVLLVALGWSPIHALRLHIWAGYAGFSFVILHALLVVIFRFVYVDASVAEQIIPGKECWNWNAMWDSVMENRSDNEEACTWAYYNLTGIVSTFPSVILWATSWNWVRRRHYRVFYVCHIICGTIFLLGSVLHIGYIAVYWLPSTVYYLASTAPTLIQALASRFRGGVRILKVVPLQNAGGCVEVHVQTNAEANAALDRDSCMYIKVCVPKISLVWHPFTVYKHVKDPSTVRFLFRPVGHFTKALADQLTGPVRPVTLIDGFYRGSDRIAEALQHDHITIVAGGIAITPFLSMIPNLLSTIAKSKERGIHPQTKGIALHWACREPGFYKFIIRNYINGMMAAAIEIQDFKFEVKIYDTTSKSNEPSSTTMESSASDFDPSSEMGAVQVAYGLSDPPGRTNTVAGAEVVFDLGMIREQDEQCEHEDCTVYEIDSDDEDRIAGTRDNNTVCELDSSTVYEMDSSTVYELESCYAADSDEPEVSGGFSMELARMMPARYRSVYRNLPLAIAFLVPYWLGIYTTFHKYYWPVQNFRQLAEMFWVAIDVICMAFGAGIIIETAVLTFRKYWPDERPDSFEVTKPDPVCSNLIGCNDDVSVQYVNGRPMPSRLLERARLAEAPGIFLCGPAAMTAALREEAGKENSVLGLTRYCLYDEPFEM